MVRRASSAKKVLRIVSAKMVSTRLMTRGATTIPATIAACLDGLVDSDGLREVVGSRLPRVVGDKLEQVGKVAQLELFQLVARAAHRVGAGAANATVGEMLSM